MAIKNVHGHAVSTAAPAHHQQVTAANLKFQDQQGKMGYNGGSKGGGSFPGARKSKGQAQPQTAVSPPNVMTGGN